MNKVMKPSSLSYLLGRISGEYKAKGSIFEIPSALFFPVFELEAESPGMTVMSGRASIPIGPAAGPHTQIAPNILSAYLAGSRVFELKTVQIKDRLELDKPCIDALDEGHNVEWSTELSLEEARKEYLNAWILVNLFAFLWSKKPGDFFFNMSVGYSLEGIKTQKMDGFIEGMRRPETFPYWSQAMEELDAFIKSPPFARAFGEAAAEKARQLAAHMPVRPVHSVTLSTMHGCPPAEIEGIGRYLLQEKGFDSYIKLNPTLLGYDKARSILDRLGWERIRVKRESFEQDLQISDALQLCKNLGAAAKEKGRRFGIKLSNTLANENEGERLPGGERYMSGRALFPFTINLAAQLQSSLGDPTMRFSYSGGVSALNAGALIKAGLGPLTLATDILKPGGYLRLAQIARLVTDVLPLPLEQGQQDPGALAALAEKTLNAPEYRADWKQGQASIPLKLPLFDCFAAPCIAACPVGQKVPAYIDAMGRGEADQALATVLSDNPLPAITGTLCDHVCQDHCSRVDYEGSVRIRDVKKLAETSSAVQVGVLDTFATDAAPAPAAGREAGTQTASPKVAVIGAGPAGLACAFHLAMSGIQVKVFEAGPAPGGVPVHTIPPFRMAREGIQRDMQRIAALGVDFAFDTRIESLEPLKAQGFSRFFLASGAEKEKTLSLEDEGVRSMGALEFLRRFNVGDLGFMKGLRKIVVAGGGNTACDAVRAATRIEGVERVLLSYRRSRAEMPADKEELENALSEASDLSERMSGAQPRLDGKSAGSGSSALLELTLPEGASPGRLRLRKMYLGEKDSSGRRKPLPSSESMDIPCDLLISAIGETSDLALLEHLGIKIQDGKLPEINPETMATEVEGLYMGGDARRGPSSIIAAEADGRAAAASILAGLGKTLPLPDYKAPAVQREKLLKRGELLFSLDAEDPGFAAREAERCLSCDSACLRCVEVCPNRANLFIESPGPFLQWSQILHIDRYCNECGNCGFFCPYQGDPCKDKATLFDNADELKASSNPGFAFILDSLPSLVLRTEAGARVFNLDYSGWNGSSSIPKAAAMIALAREVYRNHSYLLEKRL